MTHLRLLFYKKHYPIKRLHSLHFNPRHFTKGLQKVSSYKVP